MRLTMLTRALAATAIALALTACGGTPTETATRPQQGGQTTTDPQQGGQQHNQADVTFLQGMIPHHAQAIVMTQLAAQRAESEQVLQLAQDIEAAQGPEIEAMKALLVDFGAEMPMADMNHGSMGGDMHRMQGMLSPEQMHRLGQLSGPEFDTAFLEMMIEHHQGAVTMSETVLAEGKHPDVKELARQIIEVQQREIATMTALLEQG